MHQGVIHKHHDIYTSVLKILSHLFTQIVGQTLNKDHIFKLFSTIVCQNSFHVMYD